MEGMTHKDCENVFARISELAGYAGVPGHKVSPYEDTWKDVCEPVSSKARAGAHRQACDDMEVELVSIASTVFKK